jgi:hypothetical protein
MPKSDFEGYRQEVKKQYEADQDNPDLLDENLDQMPDNPSTFMSRNREKAIVKVAANDERRQVLNPRVTWDGSIDRFEIFRNNYARKVNQPHLSQPSQTSNHHILTIFGPNTTNELSEERS